MVQIIDSHAHIYGEDFVEDLDDLMSRACSAGVCQVVMPSVDRSCQSAMLEVACRYPAVAFPTIGVHPTYIQEGYEAELEYVASQLSLPHRYVAVGEIGLDYHWDTSFKAQQQDAFSRQISLAQCAGLPIIIHAREAMADTVRLVREARDRAPLSGVFHSFTGSRDELEAALEIPNFLIGINGVVTFKNSNLRDFVPLIPLDRLVLETDAPYLAPVPHRGRRNEPGYLPLVLEHLAMCYGVSVQELGETTASNTRRLFSLPDMV